MQTLIETFIQNIQTTSWIEYVAVLAGIASVWFSKRENILVYPVGLINTIAYIILSVRAHLPGEAFVNLYYTILSFMGWLQWNRQDEQQQNVLQITNADKSGLKKHFIFFCCCFTVLYVCISLLKKYFAPGAIPLADAVASAAAFTGMWLMVQKKVQSWWWWIVTNIVSIPLYLVKGYALTSVYYCILLTMAISGLIEWKKKAKRNNA